MPDYSRTRSEYLKIMYGDQQAAAGFSPETINDVGDASFDAAALTQAITDNGLAEQPTQSSFSSDRPIGEAEKTEEEDKSWWDHISDFIGNLGHSIWEGLLNFGDAIWDTIITAYAGVYGGGFFGAENAFTDWAAKAVTDDRWIAQTNRAINQLGYIYTDEFWTNEGGFWTDWSYENTVALDEEHYQGQEWVRTVGNFAGEMLPQVALAVATGGQSLTVQTLAQAGVGFARAAGNAMSQGLSEGATFQEASAYAGLSGAVEAAINAVSVQVGGFLASKGSQGIVTRAAQTFGQKVGDTFGSKTLQTVAGKSMEIMLNAGEEAGEEVVAGLLDPVFRQIYDDEAIYSAYGTPENAKNYAVQLGKAALTAAAGSALMGGVREAGSVMRSGSFNAYSAEYDQELTASANYRTLRAYDRENGTSYATSFREADAVHQNIVNANEELKAELERMKASGASEEAIAEYSIQEQNRIGKMAEDYATRYQKTFDEASKIIQSQKEADANRIEVRKTEPTDGSKPQRYSAPANLDQLRNALDGTENNAPDLVRLPIKDEYGGAELMVDRKTLTDAEKNRIVALKPSDIKTDGVTRYADISEGKIAVLNGEDSAIVEAKSIAEDGTRAFDIGGKEVKLPAAEISPIENQATPGNNLTDDTNEFARIQAESRSLLDGGSREGISERLDENLRDRLSGVFARRLGSEISRAGNDGRLLNLTDPRSGNSFKVIEKVDGNTFRDIFEVANVYLKNGELVDVHDNYDGYDCYISDDGLSGFAISADGDLVSVFNTNSKFKNGFLRAIAPIVRQRAKTLDCYVSNKQDLEAIYSKVFGFKTASIMDWNQDYDHDAIGQNHGNPKVAFMVNTDADVETRSFGKDDYDAAKKWQLDNLPTKNGSGTSRVVHDGEAPSLLGTPLTQSRGSTASDGNSIASTKWVVKSTASTGGKTSSGSQNPNGSGNDVQARYGEGVYNDSPSVIVEAANAKDGQTYALSRARKMVDDVDEYVRKFASEDAEVSALLKEDGVEIGKLRKGELAKRVFTDLNLSKKSDVATRVKEYVSNRVFDQKVSYSGDGGESSRYALGDLLTTDERNAIQAQIDKAMDELISNGRTSRYTRMQNALEQRIDRLLAQNDYIRSRAKEIASTNRMINRLKNKLGTNVNPGRVARVLRNGTDSDIDLVTLSRKLVSETRVLSRTGLSSSPKGANDLLDFNSRYTAERFGDSYLWSDDMKALLNDLQAIADENNGGRFSPYAELPIEAQRDITNFLKAIDHKLRQTQIEKWEQNQEIAGESARILYTIPAYRSTPVGRLVSSAENVVTYFETYLGRENPAYEILVTDQIKAEGTMMNYQMKYDDLANSIIKDGGLEGSKYSRELSRKVEFKGQKFAVGELVSAYYSARTKEGIANGTNEMTFYDRRNRNTSRTLRLHGEEDVEALLEAIPANVLSVTDKLSKDLLNGVMTKDFIKQFRANSGYDPEVSSDYFALSGDNARVDLNSANNAYGRNATLSNTWGRERSRTNYKGAYRIVDFRTQFANYANSLARYIGYSDYNYRASVLFNTKVEMADGYKQSFGDLMRKKAPDWAPGPRSKGKSWFNFYQERVTGVSRNDEGGFLNTIMRGGQASVLGLNPRSMAKQWLSDPTVMGDVGIPVYIKSKTRVLKNALSYKKVKQRMMDGASKLLSPTDPDYNEYAAYFAIIRDRFQNKGAVKGEISSNNLDSITGKIADVTLRGMSFFDEANNVINVWSVAETLAHDAGFAYGTNGNTLQAMKYFVDLVLRTQSNNNSFYVSQLRSGYAGKLNRFIFGLFGSDNQNRLQQFDLVIRGKINANKRAKAYKRIIDEPGADPNSPTVQAAQKALDAINKNWSGKEWGKKASGVVAAAVINALGVAAIDQFFDRLQGKDDRTLRDGFDGQEVAIDAANSLVNWLPYFGEIYDAVTTGFEISSFPEDKLNGLIDSFKGFVDALKDGGSNAVLRASKEVVSVAASLGLGIPLDNLYKYLMGITRNISESAYIQIGKWTEGFESKQLSNYYSDAIADGREADAETALSTQYALYKTGVASENVIGEVASLGMQGYNAVARNAPDYVTDEEGEKANLTENQKAKFRKTYALSDSAVGSLITGTSYQRLTDASKAKAIKRLYDAYYEYAKWAALGTTPQSRLGQLLALTDGDFDAVLASSVIQTVSDKEETSGKTRRQLAVETINRQSGLTRGARLVLLRLLGFSVAEDSRESAIFQLRKWGLSRDEAEAFLE